MSKNDSIKDLYYTFGKNFLGASIVYFPENLLELSKELNLNSTDWSKYTNKLFVFEENGNNYFIEDDLVSIKIMQKKKLLESNIFCLLKLRKDFHPITFLYIIKKYKEHLKAYKSFSQWLFDNASTYLTIITKDQKEAFKIQNEAFVAHQLEFIEIFGDLTKESTKKSFSENKHTINETIKVIMESQRESEFVSIDNKESKSIPDRRKKMMNLKELTKSYADELILKQIFNLDINTI